MLPRFLPKKGGEVQRRHANRTVAKPRSKINTLFGIIRQKPPWDPICTWTSLDVLIPFLASSSERQPKGGAGWVQ